MFPIFLTIVFHAHCKCLDQDQTKELDDHSNHGAAVALWPPTLIG